MGLNPDDARGGQHPPGNSGLFDLAADPHETKNLARDPARAGLRARLEAEFNRLQKAVGFRLPPYADLPNP
jgi:hypothetical protein